MITESLLVARLGLDAGAQGWTLPALIDTVTTATQEQLENARAHVFMSVVHLLDEYSMLSGHVRDRHVDLRALRSLFGTERHLFGCQELAPFAAPLIALQIDAHTVVSRDDGLLALALVRLVEAAGDGHLQRGAIARLLCAFSPPSQSALDDPQINQAVWERLQHTTHA